jgi:hypothetical protein
MRTSIDRLGRQPDPIGIRTEPATRGLNFKLPTLSTKIDETIEDYLLENDAVEDYSPDKRKDYTYLHIDILASAPKEADRQIIDRIGVLTHKNE